MYILASGWSLALGALRLM